MDALSHATPSSALSQVRTPAQARKVAEEFEASFLNVMFGTMMENLGNDPITGGGNAEQTYRSMLTDQYAKSIAGSGGIGIADQIYHEIIKMQENAQ